ncbi:family 43 glycosylhydrolase [Pedobacter namyangjuensis]|uniref:family 43 glycosylhydrolase n=1 Tax=Pedobacter namyangjuensis TaxID=600626 RepID=UPI000DE47972|nr:family 43 glycosylhydrolase [Pedobacter namyangjuensis]
MEKKIVCFLFLLFALAIQTVAQQHQKAGNGNPLIPGYFADPTIKKFGDTYYIYATTDGNGGGYGPSQVWLSKDFVNWSLQDMNWPTTRNYWAPDVAKGNDGKFYLYYSQPVEIFGASSDSPVGPWTSLLPAGKAVVPNFLVPNVITLDAQTFRDDDGKFYMHWGTWGIYPDHGAGVGLLNADMKSFSKLAQIPNTVAKEFFEAPFMFKRNGIYYLTYSSGRCEDGTYRVQYAMSKTGPMGPFTFGKNNPIIATNADGSVHGPGHQSVLQEGNRFYMIYHRHNNPNSEGGYHRQVVADEMHFDAEGNILKIEPSHNGIGYLGKNENPSRDLAYMSKTTASSFYSADFKSSFATDNNNGTLWKPKDNVSEAWLQLDLGKVSMVKSVHTQFEYATWFYQYKISTSVDGKTWKTFADRTKNTIHGSPMIDAGDVKARFIKITITGTEYPGINKAIWNIKVFDNNAYKPLAQVNAQKNNRQPVSKPYGLAVDLDARNLAIGSSVAQWKNAGSLNGGFVPSGSQAPLVSMIGGKKAVLFSGKTVLRSDFLAPSSLKGNSSFTVATWVYNPTVEDEEPIVCWTKRGGNDLSNGGLGYGSNKKWGAATHWGWADMGFKKVPEAGKWHHLALVFDGTMERLYVDGVLEKQERKMLFIANLDRMLLGSTTDGNAYFSGALASLKLYDMPLAADEIKQMARPSFEAKSPYYFATGDLPYGKLTSWKNEGERSGGLTGNAQLKAVEDLAAVSVEPGEFLVFDKTAPVAKSGKAYTIITQFCAAESASAQITWPADKNNQLRLNGNGKWQHVVHVFDGTKHQTYFNGLPQGKSSVETVKGGIPKLTIKAVKGAIAIASLVVYDYAYLPNVASASYQNWKSERPMGAYALEFIKKPLAITPHIAVMSARASGLPGKVIKYAFAEQGGDLAGWNEDQQYYAFGLNADQSYSYQVLAKDNFGNIAASKPGASVNTSRNQFVVFESKVGRDYNAVIDGIKDTGWDGTLGSATELVQKNGLLKLASSDTYWDGTAGKGPFIFKKVKGDFVAEVNVVDLSGLAENKVKGANDAGLMIKSTNKEFDLIQNSVLLGWGIGNMVTDFGAEGRKQTNNNTAFKFYKHLQIERSGNVFYARASNDGKAWQVLPGGVIDRPDMEGQSVEVGVYQASYGKQDGFATFKNFTVFQKDHHK